MHTHLRWSLVLSGTGVAAVLVATSRYGPGLTPDSVNYYSAAAGLLSGEGLVSAAEIGRAHV